MNLYGTELPVIHLKPGEIYIAEMPVVISTVLGSCLAVTMFNRRFRIGAICHVMLPRCRCKDNCGDDITKCIYEKKRSSGSCQDIYRYVDCSIYNMLKRFEIFGVERDDIEIKLFGGADSFLSCNESRMGMTVGKQNIEKALKIIEAERLILHASDIGGALGRKIFFYAHTGEVFLKRLEKTDEECIKE
ncbi:MAG: chemotaxis protein CheD [Nitrospirota bacterium]